jgi:serine/threonine-protein kinase
MEAEPKLPEQTSTDETRTCEPGEIGAGQSTGGEWGHLRILEEIGRGGFGSVYRAFDPTLEREVALKVFHAVAQGSDLRAEGRQLAKLRHANVVQVYGVDEHGGRAGLWMEFIHGRTLSRMLREQGRLGAHEATAIALEVCRAVAAVHASGLVHRDIKAQNVMREDGGRIVLMDFGLTGPKTDRASMTGTPVCMAPELLRGEPASVQSDIYALGILLYYLVAGIYPYEAKNFSELARLHQEGGMKLLADVRQDLPREFVRVVERAIAARPEDRYATVGQLTKALAEADQEPRARRAKPRRWAPAAVLCAMAMLGTSGWLWRDRLIPGIPASRVLGLAVLPFENLTNDPKNDYLGDGIGEEISSWLGKSKQLRVISRNSTQQFRATREPPTAIGKKLHADWLITGSVRREGTQVRVRVLVVQASDGAQRHSETHDCDLKDTLRLESQIGGSLASLLRVELDPAPAKLDPETRDLYWLALEEGQSQSPGHLRTAVKLMERVVDRAPRYAPAFAELAASYGTLGYMGGSRADVENAKRYAEQAIRMDGSLARAHSLLGFLKSMFDWDWSGAEQEFRKAAAIDPRSSAGSAQYANLLMSQGRLDEARTQLSLVEAADPLSYQIPHCRSLIAAYEGRFEDAERENATAIALSPDNPLRRAWRGYIYLQTGRNDQGIQDYQQAVQMAGSLNFRGDLGWAYARSGRTAEARQILAKLLEGGGTAAPVEVAAVYVGLGESEPALDWLEKAFAVRDPTLREIWMDAVWAPLRQHPRYRALVAKIWPNQPLRDPPR